MSSRYFRSYCRVSINTPTMILMINSRLLSLVSLAYKVKSLLLSIMFSLKSLVPKMVMFCILSQIWKQETNNSPMVVPLMLIASCETNLRRLRRLFILTSRPIFVILLLVLLRLNTLLWVLVLLKVQLPFLSVFISCLGSYYCLPLGSRSSTKSDGWLRKTFPRK